MDQESYVEINVQTILRDTQMLTGVATGVAFSSFIYLKKEQLGYLQGTAADFARLFRCTTEETDESLAMLSEQNILTVQPQEDKSVVNGEIILRISITAQNKAYGW